MCKFCNSIKEQALVSYDNEDSMNISCGQYQGVNVFGTVYMKGNMLSIACGGSYRSKSDCYYDAQGLDCDNENSNNSKPNYIKIEYCPFCGRKLDSLVFEKKKTRDTIVELKEKLKWLEQDLRDYSLTVVCEWYCNKRVLHNVEVWPGEFKDRTEYDYIEYKNDNPLTFNEIIEKFPKVSLRAYYGCPQDDWNRCIRSELPHFTLDTKIKCAGYFLGEYHSYDYKLSDDMYFKLVELGHIKHNENKYNELKKMQESIHNKINKINSKIKKLEKYLNTICS